MTKAAIIVYAGTEQPSDLGRVVNALEAVKEFDREGDEVKLLFDGGGVQWVGELADPDHDYHELYADVNQHAAVCDYCASAYGVDEPVEAAGLTRVDEFEGHPSIRDLVADGYEIITF